MILETGAALRSFSSWLLLLLTVGHLLYLVVPACGPHLYFTGFTTTLDGAFFWQRGEPIPGLVTTAPAFLFLLWIGERGSHVPLLPPLSSAA